MPPGATPQAPAEPDGLGQQLGQLGGRLELLLNHLTGEALARRVDPADLTQETLLRLLRSEATPRAAADGDAALWAFARTMARRVVVDAARSVRSDPRRFSSLQPEARAGSNSADALAFPGTGPGPATLAGELESLAGWTRAYCQLLPEHRRVLGLRRFEGLSAAETAARMGRSETAVHSLFRRALAAWVAAAEAS